MARASSETSKLPVQDQIIPSMTRTQLQGGSRQTVKWDLGCITHLLPSDRLFFLLALVDEPSCMNSSKEAISMLSEGGVA